MSLLSEYGFLRYFLPVYLLVSLALNLVVRTYVFRAKYGTDPLVEARSGPLQRDISRFKYTILAAGAVTIMVYSIFPRYYWITVPFSYADIPGTRIAGVFLLVFAFLFTALAQGQLGPSWRIGVNPGEKTPLVSGGLYRRSRNPIALGMLMVIAGFFLVIPNAITFACLCTSVVIANIRIRIEEEHLGRVHGREYEEYRMKTRKWI